MKRKIHILLTALAAATACAAPAAAEGPGTEVSVRAEQRATVTARAGGVDIANTSEAVMEADIYAITGQQVWRGTAQPGVTHVELRPGCYIVRVDGLSRRVAVN